MKQFCLMLAIAAVIVFEWFIILRMIARAIL